MTEPCRIIGVLDNGADGMTPAALDCLRRAQVVIGGRRTLELLRPHFSADALTHDLTGRLAAVPAWLDQARADGLRTVVLATGDPLCHGIAEFVIRKLGAAACEVIPNVSTLQWAFARLGLSWHDAGVCSVHTQDAGEWSTGAGPAHGLYPVLHAAARHDKLAIFTSPANTPERIARMLIMEGLGASFHFAVAARLLQTGEHVAGPLTVEEAAGQHFADPNVVILWRSAPRPPPVAFGLADDAFLQRTPEKGLITKREVRAVSLAYLGLRRNSIVWDIGAGSGAVGLEAARLCPDGYVYAVEKNTEDTAIAAANRSRLGVSNYTLVHAKAPQGLDAWPAPDAVFIGGSGGELAELIGYCLRRMNADGALVMNFVTVENLATALETLKQEQAQWNMTQIQTARGRPLLHMHRFAAENPVWIVAAQRAHSHEPATQPGMDRCHATRTLA